MRNSPLPSIKTAADFGRAYRQGMAVRDRHFSLYFRENGLGHARLGLSVSKKAGNAARRNKLRRWIREFFRHRGADFAGTDIVVSARLAAAGLFPSCRYSDVEGELLRIVRRRDRKKGAAPPQVMLPEEQ